MPVLFPGLAEPLNVRLLAAGHVNLDAWWMRTDRIREIWRLYLCDDDGAYLRIGSERYPIARNRIVIVPAGLDFGAELDRPLKRFHVHFEFVGWPAGSAREVVPQPVTLEPDALRDQLAAQLREELARAKEIQPIFAQRMGCPPARYRSGQPYIGRNGALQPDERIASQAAVH